MHVCIIDKSIHNERLQYRKSKEQTTEIISFEHIHNLNNSSNHLDINQKTIHTKNTDEPVP